MNQWLEYLGKPWVAGGRGPEEFDCWGLVVSIYRRHYYRQLPHIVLDSYDLNHLVTAFQEHEQLQHWQPVIEPDEGDLLLLRQSRHPIHVGLWLEQDGGGVLHCLRGAGVVFQDLNSLQVNGWQVAGYYRYQE